jgi:transcriptional regulator
MSSAALARAGWRRNSRKTNVRTPAAPAGRPRRRARADPEWKDLQVAEEALVVFQGVDHYISPSWYETKRETGKVVPTWNYLIVQARGRPRVIEDAGWLRIQIEALTRKKEAERAAPWAVSDAPDDFVAAQIRQIVGVEIEIADIRGKWKVSQNRKAEDRAGVIAGLRADPGEGASEMAGIVEQPGRV